MTTPEIKDRLAEIEKFADLHDPDTAHQAEDKLYIDFISYIANGGREGVQRKAKLILTTHEMDFPRWYA